MNAAVHGMQLWKEKQFSKDAIQNISEMDVPQTFL